MGEFGILQQLESSSEFVGILLQNPLKDLTRSNKLGSSFQAQVAVGEPCLGGHGFFKNSPGTYTCH